LSFAKHSLPAQQSAVALAERYAEMESWLFDSALPFWGGPGLNRENGGFHEKFLQNGEAVAGVPRRTRVVARQIFSFMAAGRMGWQGEWRSVVDHGACALFDRCIREDGLVLSTYDVDGTELNTEFDFYDHAFALFALAELAKLSDYRPRADAAALKMLAAMEQRFLHPLAGFAEDNRQGIPLRANPHMHFLEACLNHAAIPGASPIWQQWADRVVELAISKFIESESGGLREFFDFDWRPMPGESGRLIEPGHQFEWSWLLRWWNVSAGKAQVEAAASRLCEIGEAHGVNAQGITIDELRDDFSPRKASARTWPQTERLKACLASAERSMTSSDLAKWEEKAVDSLLAFRPFLQTTIKGIWHDRLSEDGGPIVAPSPASTLYHLLCALETCKAYLGQARPAIF
jgi:mannose/cellobiose epimerase-like protein (N-acyl-D-glucosamine 2-epimerase family)